MANNKIKLEFTKEQYEAIQSILFSCKNLFHFDEEEKKYMSEQGFICELTEDEHKALQSIDWFLLYTC